MRRILLMTGLIVPLLSAMVAPVFAQQSGPVRVDGGRATLAEERVAANKQLDRALATYEKLATKPKFAQLLGRAKGVMIIPRLYRAGLVFGGKGGKGVLFAQDQQSGEWSSPAFYSMFSGSVGLQIGVDVAEVAMIIVSERAMDAVLRGDFNLGTDFSVTIGSSDDRPDATTDIYTFTLVEGLFGGLSLEGGTLSVDAFRNEAFYGQQLSSRDIIIDQSINDPYAYPLRVALRGARYSEAQARAADARAAEERGQQEMQTAKAEASAASARIRELASELAEAKYRESIRGDVVMLQGVLFDTGTANLQSGGRKKLEPLVEFLKEQPNRRIIVEGHTDDVGGEDFNRDLSWRRAQTVRNVLVEQGIDVNRILVAGVGSKYPVASNATPEGRQQNRRVEVVIKR